MNYFIYGRPEDWLFRYGVIANAPWPSGRVVGVAATLWGARRLIRREVSKPELSRPIVEGWVAE